MAERAKRRCGSFEPVLLAPFTPLAERGYVASKFSKRGVWVWDCIGPKVLLIVDGAEGD